MAWMSRSGTGAQMSLGAPPQTCLLLCSAQSKMLPMETPSACLRMPPTTAACRHSRGSMLLQHDQPLLWCLLSEHRPPLPTPPTLVLHAS